MAMARKIFRSNVPPPRRDVWQEFANNEELLKTHRVTNEELASLKNVALLGTLKDCQDLVFILKQMRFARSRR